MEQYHLTSATRNLLCSRNLPVRRLLSTLQNVKFCTKDMGLLEIISIQLKREGRGSLLLLSVASPSSGG